MKRINVVLAGLFLLLPLQLRAEFTEAERTSLNSAILANESVRDSIRLVCLAAGQSGTEEPRPALARALGRLVSAGYNGNMAVAYLLEVYSGASFSDIEAFKSESRAGHISTAFSKIDFALGRLSGALTDLEKAALLEAGNADYQAAVTSARQSVLRSISRLNAVDRTLAYAEPFPSTYPKMFGPHGDYDKAQWNYVRGVHYGYDALSDLVGAYAGGASSEGIVWGSFYRACFELVLGQNDIAHTYALFANVTRNSQEAGLSLVDRTLLALKLATVSAPGRLERALGSATDWWAKQDSVLAQDSIRKSIPNTGDAWAHTDDGTWQVLIILR